MFWLIKLSFKRSLTLSSSLLSDDDEFKGIIHSDTLFSALVSQWMRLPECNRYNNWIKVLIKKLNSETPPFRLTSAFPYMGNTFYLPTPRGTSNFYQSKLKDVHFLDLNDFKTIINDENSLLSREFNDPLNEIMFPTFRPRVTIDRISTVTQLYESFGFSFKYGAGLFFIVEINDSEFIKLFTVGLNLLAEEGLGGDRSVGNGHFIYKMTQIDNQARWKELLEQKPKGTYINLSLCSPKNNEAVHLNSFKILNRRGWFHSYSTSVQLKRKECKMVAEGSIFTKPINGQVVNVTPDLFLDVHTIHRYGLSFIV